MALTTFHNYESGDAITSDDLNSVRGAVNRLEDSAARSVEPAEDPDGVRTQFTAPHAYVANTLQVWVSGSHLSRAHNNFVETTPASGVFTLAWPPDASESIILNYLKAE